MTSLVENAITAVNEQTECYANLSFLDQNGNPYVPTQVRYRLDSILYNQVILTWTVWPGILSSSIQIVITKAQNVKLGNEPEERREVTVETTAPGGAVRYDDRTYSLIRIPIRMT